VERFVLSPLEGYIGDSASSWWGHPRQVEEWGPTKGSSWYSRFRVGHKANNLISKIMWHVNLLLGNRGPMFSMQSVPRCYKQGHLAVNELVGVDNHWS
jgi:hypothetical protein